MLNKQLWDRKPDLSPFQHLFLGLMEAVKNMRSIDCQVFRGQQDLYVDSSTYDIGKTVMWRAFTSVSTNRSIAESFANTGRHPTMFIVDGLPSYASADLKEISKFPEESELLVRPVRPNLPTSLNRALIHTSTPMILNKRVKRRA